MNYLTAIELAELVGCEKNSYACMRRWLTRNDWPYAKSITGLPKVSRAYHDARMNGAVNLVSVEQEPDFGALAA